MTESQITSMWPAAKKGTEGRRTAPEKGGVEKKGINDSIPAAATGDPLARQ